MSERVYPTRDHTRVSTLLVQLEIEGVETNVLIWMSRRLAVNTAASMRDWWMVRLLDPILDVDPVAIVVFGLDPLTMDEIVVSLCVQNRCMHVT